MPAMRPAVESDLAFLESVFLRSMCASITAARGYWDEARERKQFRDQLPLGHTQVIEDAGESIGFFTLTNRNQVSELHTFCIAPEKQGRGTGSAVIQQITSDAASRDVRLLVSVLKTNTRARSLYERLGFAIRGETEHHFQMSVVE
jgi:ribosomal protein S18 acetylase RimI-like enzyme